MQILTTNARQAAYAICIGFLLSPIACWALPPEMEASIVRFASTPGSKMIVCGVLLTNYTLGIWLASRILGIEGGFWRSAVAAVIAFVATVATDPVFHVWKSFLVFFLVGTAANTVAIKFTMQASLPQALICSILSSVMSAMLFFVIGWLIMMQMMPA